MYRMKLFSLVLVGLIGMSTSAYSQTDEKQAVQATIEKMFDGMREADSSKVHQVFMDDALMQTAGNREGSPILFTGSLERFLKAIGTPHDKTWDERIANLEIHVDDRLATAWMDYAFYIEKDFSHCGINTMTLYKSEDGWKIIFIADTRRKENCGLE